MHNSTFVLEGHHHQELPLSLKRETTEEMSKMFTTLYDNEDPQQQQQQQQLQQQELSQLLLQQQQQPDAVAAAKLFADALASPWIEGFVPGCGGGPASPESCFSASSSSYSESAQSSPKTMDADETDALIDMFRITIEDLLAGNPLPALQQQLQCPEGGVIDYTSDFALYAPPSTPTTTQQQQFITAAAGGGGGGAALQFGSSTLEQQQQHYPTLHHHQSMHRPVGPHRSGSLSPVMSCAPYPATQQHHHHLHNHHRHSSSASSSSHSSSRFSPHSPEQQHFEIMMPHSPVNTYALPPTPSPSTTPCMSPMSPSIASFETTTTTTLPQVNNINNIHNNAPVLMNLPSSTEDITVVKNGDGSIMVYNRQTESMTFRCELCPNESFGRIHDLKRHQASKHQEITWPCEFCHRPFVRRDALLRHYTVKASREDGVHPASHETELLMAARARAKLIC
ncbi:MAG: hypothetical protein J3Q66DRAFT_337753 [Benniella sp.]|nr:MAG: hypothetical protein J3Q66DRAFT_337753 [Benniella sp.]